MLEIKHSMNLKWKEFSLDLPSVQTKVKQIMGEDHEAFAGNSADANSLILYFTAKPTDEQIDLINAFWDGLTEVSQEAAAYELNKQKEAFKKALAEAKKFGSDLVDDFTTENLMMGVTEDGKTAEVLSLVLPIKTALESGSLKEAIRMAKAIPSSSYIPKYVTAARLLALVNKVEEFLKVPLSVSL